MALVFLAALVVSTGTAKAQESSDFIALYFDRLDQNGDGAFSSADLQRISAKEFNRTDDNKDGALTLDEYLYGIPAERKDAIDYFTRRFENSDRDDDNRISFAEDQDYCVRLIMIADANHDGLVQRAEFLESGELLLP